MTYLDSNIVIYLVEWPALLTAAAVARLQTLIAAGPILACSELTRLECCCRPLGRSDFALLRRYDDFFARPNVQLVAITPAVFRRATVIRAYHGFGTLDALHLAAAVEGGCQHFLTNDARLSGFPDLTVEVLN